MPLDNCLLDNIKVRLKVVLVSFDPSILNVQPKVNRPLFPVCQETKVKTNTKLIP